MRVLITRYPASEDRLIVRPLLCRRCALRLQPAEPQPYSGPKKLQMVESQKLEEKAKKTKEADAGAAVARACGVINK